MEVKMKRSQSRSLTRLTSLAVLSICLIFLWAGPSLSASGEKVTPEELKSMLDKNEPAVLIDVRTPEEFAAGHIPGARSMPIDTLENVESLPPGGRTILYCKSGKRSQRAFEILSGRGFTDLSVLEGGLEAWKESGGTVVEGPPPAKP
jgi:phage shock protein E